MTTAGSKCPECDYMVWRQALPAKDCAALVASHRQDLRRIRRAVTDAWDAPPRYRDAPDPLSPDEPLWVGLADLMLPDLFGLALAERMPLPFDPASLVGWVGQYSRGAFLAPHVDDWLHFAFNVLLNDDFTGGEFVANGEVVPLGVGDLVGVGPGCVHEVRPVRLGERYVLGCGA